MIYNQLGRTGLKVSAIGVGAGGPSRLGASYGRMPDDAIRLIRFAIERGINVIDTATTYGTEEIVGRAIEDCRHNVILSTKAALGPYFGRVDGKRNVARLAARLGEVAGFVASGRMIEQRVNSSLRHLNTDYIDLFNLHTVTPEQYGSAVERVVPALVRLKEAGKIRWIGITEAFPRDRSHKMLARAVNEGAFDSIMIGFNALDQSGKPIAARAQQNRKGVIAMCAVRAFRKQESLQVVMDRLVASGCIEKNDGDAGRLVSLLTTNGVSSLPEAAIRFCRHELKPSVILCGTGDRAHLDADVKACQAEPLPEVVSAEFRRLFSKLISPTGDEGHSVISPNAART